MEGLWALLLPVLTGVGLVSLAVVVAVTGWMHPHNRIFSTLFTLSGLKSISDGMLAVGPNGAFWADIWAAKAPLFPRAATFDLVVVFLTFWMIPLLLLLVSRFPHPARWVRAFPRLQVVVFLPSAAASLLLAAQPAIIQDIDFSLRLAFIGTASTFVALGLLTRAFRRAGNKVERNQAFYLLVGFIPSFVASWALAALVVRLLSSPDPAVQLQASVWINVILHYVSPILELLAASLVAYAILKYRILNTEIRLKGGVKYAIMTFTVGSVLFLTSTYVTDIVLQGQVFNFLNEKASAVLTGLIGMLLFRPVEKLGEALTERLFPGTREHHYAATRAREIYMSQLTHIIRDGHVSDREWTLLRRLRHELRLDPTTARDIEHAAEQQMGIDIPDLGIPA